MADEDPYAAFRKRAEDVVSKDSGLGFVDDTTAKFKQWKDEHPAVQWATGPGLEYAANAMGPTTQLAHTLMTADPGIRNPTSFERDPGPTLRNPISFERDAPATPVTPVTSLPNAPLRPPMSAGMGPGGDTSGGYGTDRAILNSQLNQAADIGGYQEKKGEEGEAHLHVMDTQADQAKELAQFHARSADAIKAAADAEDERQRGQEEKIQAANDASAAAGIDPGRHFRNRDAGFWMNMMVGSVASGLLSAMTNQNTNPFMDSVRETVRSDINAQEKGIEQGWRRTKGLETTYERMRQSGADRVSSTIRQYDKHLEALQTDMQGRLIKATVPETKANLEAGLQAIQLERDKYATQMQEYQQNVRTQKMRAAAALAAAQHAADRQARLDQQKWEMDKSQIAKNYAEAGKAANGPDEGAKFIATSEQQAGLPGLEATIETARQAHQNTPITTAQRFAAAGGFGFQDAPAKYKMMFGKEAAEREQAWSSTVAQVRHELAGANVSPSEAKPITAMLEGAGDGESRMSAIEQAQKVIAAKRANIRAAVPDSGRSYDKNKSNIPNESKAPSLSGITSFKPKVD